MRVKWNEISLPILRRLGGFGTNNSYTENFAKCEICGSRTCFRVLDDLVPICVNSTHLERKIIPVLHRRYINSYRQKQKTLEILVLISPPPPRHRNLTYTNVTLPKCALLVPIFTQM